MVIDFCYFNNTKKREKSKPDESRKIYPEITDKVPAKNPEGIRGGPGLHLFTLPLSLFRSDRNNDGEVGGCWPMPFIFARYFILNSKCIILAIRIYFM